MNEKTCKNCIENEDGLCDRKGILVGEDDSLREAQGRLAAEIVEQI